MATCSLDLRLSSSNLLGLGIFLSVGCGRAFSELTIDVS